MLEDSSSSGSIEFVRSVERIKEDGCFPNRKGENEDDRESPQYHYIEPW